MDFNKKVDQFKIVLSSKMRKRKIISTLSMKITIMILIVMA